MLLMIDIGNSTMNIGTSDIGGSDIKSARFPTMRRDTMEAHAVTIINALSLMSAGKRGNAGQYNMGEAKILAGEIEGAVIASVVPAATNAVAGAVRRLFGVEPVIVGSNMGIELNIIIDGTGVVGADLVATAVGAVSRYDLPVLVYDLGTATKITVIARNGKFMGGMIYPGVGISLGALGDAASLLPSLAIDKPPKSAVTLNTADAMQAGILYGTAGALDGMSSRIEDETGEKYARVATGGFAPYITPLLRMKAVLREDLIFDGMKVIYGNSAKRGGFYG